MGFEEISSREQPVPFRVQMRMLLGGPRDNPFRRDPSEEERLLAERESGWHQGDRRDRPTRRQGVRRGKPKRR